RREPARNSSWASKAYSALAIRQRRDTVSSTSRDSRRGERFMSNKLSSKEIRKRIGHPVIDADGHWLEFGPSINDYLKEVGGQSVVDAFRKRAHYVQKSLAMTPTERAQTRRAQEAFWGVPARNTLDRATAMLPRLLYERLD